MGGLELREKGSKAVNSTVLCVLLRAASVTSCLGFPQWWTVTIEMKQPFLLFLVMVFAIAKETKLG